MSRESNCANVKATSWMIWDSILQKGKWFVYLQSVHASSRAHPVGTGRSFLGIQWLGLDFHHSSTSRARKNRIIGYLNFPYNISSRALGQIWPLFAPIRDVIYMFRVHIKFYVNTGRRRFLSSSTADCHIANTGPYGPYNLYTWNLKFSRHLL